MGSMHAGSKLVLKVSEFNPIFNMHNSAYNTVPVNNEQISIFSRLKEDIDRLETKTDQHSHTEQTLLYALSPLPPIRRIESLPDSLEENNYPRAGLLVGMAAANFPGDLREIGLAVKEAKNVFKEGLKGLKSNPYQHEMSFFKYTLLNSLSEKIKFLEKADITLFDTKFGEFLQNKLNLGIDYSDIGTVKGAYAKETLIGYKYTGNLAQRTIARTLHRIPVIGLVASTVLEIPALIRSITKTEGNALDKVKAFGKQLIKSAGYVGFTTAAISIMGAITFPCSALLALIGMAIGSVIGLEASKRLNKMVDEFSL